MRLRRVARRVGSSGKHDKIVDAQLEDIDQRVRLSLRDEPKNRTKLRSARE